MGQVTLAQPSFYDYNRPGETRPVVPFAFDPLGTE